MYMYIRLNALNADLFHVMLMALVTGRRLVWGLVLLVDCQLCVRVCVGGGGGGGGGGIEQ